MTEPNRILVRGPNWIGDHVMAIPFYQALRQVYPTSSLHLVAVQDLSGVLPRGLFDEVHLYPIKTLRTVRGLFTAAKHFRQFQFSLGIGLPSSYSSGLLLTLSGISFRVGFSEERVSPFLTTALRWEGVESKRHKRDLYLDLIRFLGSEPCRIPESTPPFPLSNPDRKRRIVVAPGASIPLREWPYYPEWVRAWVELHPEDEVFIVGTLAEAKWRSLFQRQAEGRYQDLIGSTSLSQLLEILKSADLVVANDSGVGHLAASLAQVPTLVLFGPGDPSYVKPDGPWVRVVRHPIPCSPCEKATCRSPYGYQTCLRELSIESVVYSAEVLTNRTV